MVSFLGILITCKLEDLINVDLIPFTEECSEAIGSMEQIELVLVWLHCSHKNEELGKMVIFLSKYDCYSSTDNIK